MPQKYCHQVGEWVEDNVSQQLEKCVERKCKWWCACCNKWLCALVWVVVTIVKWAVTTVCELLGDGFDLFVALLSGGWDVIAGIFTWDWSRVWDGFMKIVGAAGGLLGDLIRAVSFCGLIGGFRDSVNKWRLRGYVKDLVDNAKRFSDKERIQIKEALGIDGGDGFGFRLTAQSYRGYVRSDYIKPGETLPALVAWHNDINPDTNVDLKILAGFSWTKFFERGKPEIRGDSGDISEGDIDAYLTDPASTKFSIYAMSDAAQLDRIHAIQTKGDTIGLKLIVNLNDVLLTDPMQVRAIPSSNGVVNNLAGPPFNRPPVNSPDAVGALCTPIVLGTFMFQDNSHSGYSAHLRACTCLDGTTSSAAGGTGAEYRYRLPDFSSTYVAIHELGHTFGLCHVGGLDRIMVTPRDRGFWWWWSGWLLPEYLCFSGEPQFVYDEAKKVWDYIIANFPADCLTQRHFG